MPGTPYSTPKPKKRPISFSPSIDKIEPVKKKKTRISKKKVEEEEMNDFLLLQATTEYVKMISWFTWHLDEVEQSEEQLKEENATKLQGEKEKLKKKKEREKKKIKDEKEKEKIKKQKEKNLELPPTDPIFVAKGREYAAALEKKRKTFKNYSHNVDLSTPKWKPLRMDYPTPVTIPGSEKKAYSVRALWDGFSAYQNHEFSLKEVTKGKSKVKRKDKGKYLGHYLSAKDTKKIVTKGNAKKNLLRPAYIEQLEQHPELVDTLIAFSTDGLLIIDSESKSFSKLGTSILKQYLTERAQKEHKKIFVAEEVKKEAESENENE